MRAADLGIAGLSRAGGCLAGRRYGGKYRQGVMRMSRAAVVLLSFTCWIVCHLIWPILW